LGWGVQQGGLAIWRRLYFTVSVESTATFKGILGRKRNCAGTFILRFYAIQPDTTFDNDRIRAFLR
jgi:hypothetical protein